ncbi:hypothetical protein CF327_g5053 [Tilletia walkeri]|uniref:Uncharacterized protein n=1 Tax=Tilletia walkeri TaxID=117179 RepID=A0A8X7T4H9_9BASI|nr:hypothetical protein CF327_g5053 [Tilletia walkeri]KAE8268466.1 hypothetical protein A4X09_0g3874 [Tilletia walkeri]
MPPFGLVRSQPFGPWPGLGRLPPQRSAINPSFHVCRSGFLDGGLAACSLTLPWTKTTRGAGAVIALHQRGADLCPIAAFQTHCALSPGPGTAALFAYRQSSSLVPLSRSVLLARLAAASKAAELPVLHGHSFRIGGCTELLLRGTAIEDVKAHGRW